MRDVVVQLECTAVGRGSVGQHRGRGRGAPESVES